MASVGPTLSATSLFRGELKMAFLTGTFIPPVPAMSGGDLWIAVVAIVLFAIAAVVAVVVANRPVKPRSAVTQAPRTILPTPA